MRMSDGAKTALAQPDTHATTLEMTDERREKFSRVSNQLVSLLKANTEGPLEAYMLLQLVQHGFEETYGIRGGIMIDKTDHDQS